VSFLASNLTRGLVAALILALSVDRAGAAAREHITFNAARRQLDAEIESWPLEKVLARLGAATGWRVYVVPDTEDTVTTSFRQLDTGDALRRLLGAFNFALLPQSDGSTALFVFRRSAGEATRLVARRPGVSIARGAPIPGAGGRAEAGAHRSIDAGKRWALALSAGSMASGPTGWLSVARTRRQMPGAAWQATPTSSRSRATLRSRRPRS
jgi:hypothetical protein